MVSPVRRRGAGQIDGAGAARMDAADGARAPEHATRAHLGIDDWRGRAGLDVSDGATEILGAAWLLGRGSTLARRSPRTIQRTQQAHLRSTCRVWDPRTWPGAPECGTRELGACV